MKSLRQEEIPVKFANEPNPSIVSMTTVPMKSISQESRSGLLSRINYICSQVARSGAVAIATFAEQLPRISVTSAAAWPKNACRELLSAIGPPPRQIRVAADEWEQDAPLEYFWAINLLMVCIVAAFAFTVAAFVPSDIEACQFDAEQPESYGSIGLTLTIEGSLRKLFSFVVMLGIIKCWSPLHSSLISGL